MSQVSVAVDDAAQSPTADNPNPTGHRSVEAEFMTFFTERDKSKTSIYSGVVFHSFYSILFGVSLLLLGVVLLYTSDPFSPQYTVFALFELFGVLCSSYGLSVISTVPVEEFDLDQKLNSNETLLSYIKGGLVVFCLLGGVVSSSFFPYITGAPFLVLAPYIFFHKGPENEASPITAQCQGKEASSITLKMAMVSGSMLLPLTAVDALVAFRPSSLTANLLIPGLWSGWVVTLQAHPLLTVSVYSISFAIHVIIILWLLALWYRWACMQIRMDDWKNAAKESDKNEPPPTPPPFGWRTHLFFATLYCWMVGSGITTIVINAPVLIWGVELVSRPQVPYNLAVSVMLLLPPLAALLIGPQRVFSHVARIFELDLSRLRDDGAHLATLVAKCTLVDNEHKFYWLHRKNPCSRFEGADKNVDLIKRSSWLYGSIVSSKKDEATSNVTLTLCFSMSIDMDDSWGASFKGQSVCFTSRGESYATNPSPTTTRHTVEQFEAWVAENFGGRPAVYKADLQMVTVTEELKGNEITAGDVQELRTRKELGDEMFKMCEKGLSEKISKLTVKELLEQCREGHEDSVHGEMLKMKLLAFSKSHFRFFSWDKCSADEVKATLFQISPRELKEDQEKLDVYKLSDPKVVRRNGDKIDYFVSHSWEDKNDAKISKGDAKDDTKDDAKTSKGGAKMSKMEAFMAREKAATGKFPTLWLDKVCINQSDPGNGLAVLPINVGACERMLVLLSKSYLKRLWCVWELFSLFTFCYKELAHQRIVIVPLFGDASESEKSVPCLLKGFDLDKAHCYDPNEEFKLRSIMHAIGLERLDKCIKEFIEKQKHHE